MEYLNKFLDWHEQQVYKYMDYFNISEYHAMWISFAKGFVLALLLVILSGWVGISYYVRGEFLREKSKDYVSAAIAMGQTRWKVMFKHILPNALTPIITGAPFAILGYITSLVGLDYLGFGLQPPTPSWGEMINQAAGNLQNWHLVVFPLIMMAITLFLIETWVGRPSLRNNRK